jgi:hypothetical protein
MYSHPEASIHEKTPNNYKKRERILHGFSNGELNDNMD